MDVSRNRGTPKSSILIGFSIINHPFWGTTIFGNTHIKMKRFSSDLLPLKGMGFLSICVCHDIRHIWPKTTLRAATVEGKCCGIPTMYITPQKINGWNLKFTQLKSGKSSEPNHHFQVRCVNLRGCIHYLTLQPLHPTQNLNGSKTKRKNPQLLSGRL